MTLTQIKYVIEIANSSSMNEAAKNLFVSQPSLSSAVRDLETEIGITIFVRSNKGVQITPEGADFLGYARQLVEQYSLIESKYINKKDIKKKFSVSTQHYTFAVEAFVELMKQFSVDDFDFSIIETKTGEVISNVENFISELGILYLNDFNRDVLTKLFSNKGLSFHKLFDCHVYAYLSNQHPLAGKELITMEDLKDYPCLAFDQGDSNSFYFSEEPFSTFEYKQLIHANDRGTMLNLCTAMNGYTICSGIICEELNGNNFVAVRLDSDDIMSVGYIKKTGIPLSKMGQIYVDEISKYKDNVLK